MKKSNIILIIAIILVIFIIGAVFIIQSRNNQSIVASTLEMQNDKFSSTYMNKNDDIFSEKLVSMYETIIDTIMPVDTALNMGDVLYLDVNSFVAPIERGNGAIENKYMGLSDKEKEQLLEYCKKYKSEVKGLSMVDLREQGIFDEENLVIRNGFLIYATNIKECTENSAEMEVVKYFSGLGAVGFTYTLTYENDKWNIEATEAWIS